MQNIKKLTLIVMIQAALVSSVYANEQAEAKGFVEGADGTVLFRTGFLSRDKKNGVADTRSSAQTAIVKLDSGFTKGVVGFGAGIIGDASFKIGKNAHAGNNMIPLHNNGAKDAQGRVDPYSTWARGGAYVKARVSNTTATYGTQVLDIPVLASNTARLVPEYFTGVLVTSNEIDKLKLTAGKFTKDQYSDQLSTDGRHLKSAVVWGAKYDFNDHLNSSYYGVDVKDKLERHYASVNSTHDLKDDSSLTLDLSGYHTKFDKDANTYSQTTTDLADRHNTIWAVSSAYNKDVHNIMLAYQQNSGNVGYDYGENADGGQSMYLPNSYLSDFIGNKEKSAQLQYSYNFKNHGIPGLNWTTAFVYGWDIHVANPDNRAELITSNAQEHEFFNQVKYTVQSGHLKDASLRLRHSYYRASDDYQSSYIGDTNEWRIWLDIPVKLF